MIIIKIIILYSIQIRHTEDFPSTGTRLVKIIVHSCMVSRHTTISFIHVLFVYLYIFYSLVLFMHLCAFMPRCFNHISSLTILGVLFQCPSYLV